MKISSWNVNSVRARILNITNYLKSSSPDILIVQEIKTEEKNFPFSDFKKLGYKSYVFGQKSYNGVAILSKVNIDKIDLEFINDENKQSRIIVGEIKNKSKRIKLINIYAPNGNPSNSPKFTYKLKWMDRLLLHAKNLLHNEEVVVLGGDYNVIPSDGDVYDPSSWHDDALFKTETRSSFQAIINLGYTEAFRALNKQTGMYTFWDYQKGRFQRDEGLRIDHFLLSPEAADLLNTCTIDRKPRSWTKTSDHTPVLCELR